MALQDQPVIPYPGAKSPTTARSGDPGGSVLFDPPSIQENDTRSRQFACRLVLRNNTSAPVDVLAINCRLGFGVTMERRESISSPDLKKEYDQMRTDVRALCRDVYIAYSDQFRSEFTEKFLKGVKDEFSLLNFLTAGGFRLFANHMTATIQRMDFSITSSADASRVLRGVRESNVNPAVAANRSNEGHRTHR